MKKKTIFLAFKLALLSINNEPDTTLYAIWSKKGDAMLDIIIPLEKIIDSAW